MTAGGRADNHAFHCTRCGRCEERCPRHIPIIALLAESHRLRSESQET